MNIICKRNDLHKGVQIASRAVSARTSLPILGHLLITAEEDRLRITATDLEIGLGCVVEAKVIEPGLMTVPAKIMAELLGSLPEEDVSIAVDSDCNVSIKCAASDFSLKSLPPEEFPTLPEVVEETSFIIDRDLLLSGIKKTAFAVGVDESRAILTGILMQVSESGSKLVSTDTHRLCVLDLELVECRGGANAIVPGRALNELARVLPEELATVSIGISNNQIKFTAGDTVLVSRLIDGQFPKFEKVIPAECATTLFIPTQQFEQSLKRASIIARDNTNRVIIQTQDGNLIITAKSGSVGSAHEEIGIVQEGEDTKMAFNARYLLDVLNVIEAENVEIKLGDKTSPIVASPRGAEDYLCVVMPVLMNWE